MLDQLPEGASRLDKKRALSDAYPFGVRANFPYRVWCREVRRALRLPPQGREQLPLFAEGEGE